MHSISLKHCANIKLVVDLVFIYCSSFYVSFNSIQKLFFKSFYFMKLQEDEHALHAIFRWGPKHLKDNFWHNIFTHFFTLKHNLKHLHLQGKCTKTFSFVYSSNAFQQFNNLQFRRASTGIEAYWLQSNWVLFFFLLIQTLLAW